MENSLHPDAERAIQDAGDVLEGCRGSLEDYLVQRVDYELQYGYVQRVVTSLGGSDEWMWTDRRGRRLHEGRTEVLAGALNELLSCEETGKHFPEPPGGFGNLRSKVRYLVASRLGAERDAEYSGDRPRLTAAQEEAREQQRREAARKRSDLRQTDDEAGEAQAHVTAMAEAKRWYQAQPPKTRTEIRHDAESRVKLLYADERKAPHGYAEACFLEAVNARREHEDSRRSA